MSGVEFIKRILASKEFDTVEAIVELAKIAAAGNPVVVVAVFDPESNKVKYIDPATKQEYEIVAHGLVGEARSAAGGTMLQWSMVLDEPAISPLDSAIGAESKGTLAEAASGEPVELEQVTGKSKKK